MPLDNDSRNRELRRIYRQTGGRDWPMLRGEFERLYGRPAEWGEIERIVSTAFVEARQLAGWTRDRMLQAWRRADGSVVQHDDGSEWRHV